MELLLQSVLYVAVFLFVSIAFAQQGGTAGSRLPIDFRVVFTPLAMDP